MAKGIIVLDKVPQTCQHIRGNKENGCPFGGMVCQICDTYVMEHTVHGTKPDWCPIKPMPKRKEVRWLSGLSEYSDWNLNGQDRGWNACLDEIEGKM